MFKVVFELKLLWGTVLSLEFNVSKVCHEGRLGYINFVHVKLQKKYFRGNVGS